jgi:hypothetical protein
MLGLQQLKFLGGPEIKTQTSVSTESENGPLELFASDILSILIEGADGNRSELLDNISQLPNGW